MDPILDPILLVDDEKDNLQALQRLLRGEFQVATTASPIEALQLIGSHTYNVIVSDQRMPSMSGVELLEKAKKLSPHSTRILLTGYTDIDSVIDSINRGHIYRYIAKPWDPEELKLTLRQANEAFRMRKELEEKNQVLEKTLSELSLLDKAKARFLSLISHELNTPLTVLQSFMSILSQSQAELSNDLQKSVSALSRAVQRFSEIVNEVLVYTKIESSGKLKFSRISVPLQLRKLLSDLTVVSEPKKIQLVLKNSEDLYEELDWEKMELALRKIFMAVLDRASAETSIEFSLSQNQKNLELLLKWNGDSLPLEAFKPFETGESELHHHKNLGLSLAIAKLIIEGHGGSIQNNSTEESKLNLVLKSIG